MRVTQPTETRATVVSLFGSNANKWREVTTVTVTYFTALWKRLLRHPVHLYFFCHILMPSLYLTSPLSIAGKMNGDSVNRKGHGKKRCWRSRQWRHGVLQGQKKICHDTWSSTEIRTRDFPMPIWSDNTALTCYITRLLAQTKGSVLN